MNSQPRYPQHPDVLGDLMLFHSTARPGKVVPPMQAPSKESIVLAQKLIEEEAVCELLAEIQQLKNGAYSLELMTKIMNSCVDSIYVILHTMVEWNLPFDLEWNAVQKNNMDKFPIHEACKGEGCLEKSEIFNKTVDGRIVQAYSVCINGRQIIKAVDTAKVLKPDGWTAHDSHKLLYNYWQQLITDKAREDNILGSSGMIG